MTRILGFLLGVSFQTELLIMTLLGLANSTLNWKPFDLEQKLDSIRNLNFLENGLQFSHAFATWAKLVLRLTVVLEFFCSLVLPFVYLLKLYPIITWSRPYILLPWLITHALNTILPKMLSVAFAFVFHQEGIVSTMSFLEFLVVESINLAIASYNWYVFFTFYEDLQRVERKRKVHKIYLKALESVDRVQTTCSSVPDIHQALRKSSADELNGRELRATRSLTLNISALGNGSQDLESEDSYPGLMDDSALHTEKTVLSQNLTVKGSEESETDAGQVSCSLPSVQVLATPNRVNRKHPAPRLGEGIDQLKQSTKAVGGGCACTSSEEDDEVKLLVSERIRTKPPATHEELDSYILQSVLEIETRRKARLRPKKTNNQSMQTIERIEQVPLPNALLFLPNAPIRLNQRDGKSTDFSPFARKDLKFFNSIYKSMDLKNQTASHSDQKWLIFHSELESNLKGDVFLKELNSDTSLNEHHMRVIRRLKRRRDKSEDEFDFWENNPSKTSRFGESKWSHVQNMIDHSMGRMNRAISLQKSGDEMSVWNVQKKMSDFSGSSEIDEISKTTISSQAEKESSRSSHSTTRNSMPYPRLPKYQKSNISVLKSIKPSKWSQFIESQKNRELQNLQIYNDLYYDQDAQDGPQKRKRSKLTNYKNVANELSLFNSDVTVKKESGLVQDRACRSTGVQRTHVERSHQHQGSKTNRSIKNNFELTVEDEKAKMSSSSKRAESHDRTLEHLFEEELTNYDNNARFETLITKPNQRDAQIPSSVMNLSTQNSGNVKLDRQSSVEVSIPLHRASLREAIEQLDWSCQETPVESTSIVVTNFDGKVETMECQPQRESRNLVDDETMSLLRNAFSHSDESDRGFHLGVEAGEPYPLFQTLTLTVAEIYKAVSLGREPTTDQLSISDDANGIELQLLEDSIVCGCDDPDIQETAVDATPDVDAEDEVEKRKSASAELLDQLQQLLDSSRRTLSALEIVRGEVRIAESQLFAGSTTGCIDAFKELYESGKKMKGVASRSHATNVPRDSSKIASTLEGARAQFPMASANDEHQQPVRDGTRGKTDRGDGRREKAGGSGAGRRKSKPKVFETIFENKMQMHQVRRGEGLSSGNVMEFDSEGQVLSCMESRNPSLVVQPKSDTARKDRNQFDEDVSNLAIVAHRVDKITENRGDFGGTGNLASKVCPCGESDHNSSQDVRVINGLKERAITSNFPEQTPQMFDNGERLSTERDNGKSARDRYKSKTESSHQDNNQLLSRLEVELKSSDLSSAETGMKFEDVVGCNSGKQDKHTNGREVASSAEVNIPTIIAISSSNNARNEIQNYQQLLNNHRRMLESDTIKNTIDSWASGSNESLYSIDHRDYRNPTPPQEISFSNASDFEEF